ncbi:hypothetical protein FRB95_013479, partial [Tulasnella sp. JGI-2019a]
MGTLDQKEQSGAAPMKTESANSEIATVFNGGVVVKSYEGTSQYTHRGISACGLASFNAVRCVLEVEGSGTKGADLLRMMLSRDLVEEATEICASWSSSAHLEVDELIDLPLFHRTLRAEGNDFSQANLEHFTRVLRRLEAIGSPDNSSAAIITKPPEILAVFAIATHAADPFPTKVFVVFDSHSRPDHHPNGAAFSFFGTLETAAAYLSDLLSVDPNLLNDQRMQWQAQLLSQCSAHFLVARSTAEQLLPGEEKLPDPLYDANIAVLEAKSNFRETRATLIELEARNFELESENMQVKSELKELRKQFSLLAMEIDGARRLNAQGHGSSSYSNTQHNGAGSRKGKEKEKHDTSQLVRGREDVRPGTWTNQQLSMPNLRDYIPSASTIKDVILGPTPAEAHGQFQQVRNGERAPSIKLRNQFAPLSQHAGPETSYASAADASRSADQKSGGHKSDYEMALELQSSARADLMRDTLLAREMQIELDKQAEVERAQYISLVESSQKRFDCKICFDTLPEDVVAGLEGCDHRFCRDCLSQYVKSTLKDIKFPIICPVCVSSPLMGMSTNAKGDEGTSSAQATETGGVVTHDTFQLLGISEKHYNKWVELEMGKFSTVLDCSKCRKSVLVDKHDLTVATIITCPMRCGNLWCKKCSKPVDTPYESDHSCDGTVELEAMIQKEGWKRCPTCQIPVERTVGCNHMTCKVPACNTHFCYVDGAFICQTQNGAIAKKAVDKHYSQNCSLFEVPT